MRAAFILLALTGCAAAASAEPFEVIAYEGLGIQPIAGEIIISDARARIPALLKACGIEDAKTVDATDGVVFFRFTAPAKSEELQCVRQKLPAGTRLQQAAFE